MTSFAAARVRSLFSRMGLFLSPITSRIRDKKEGCANPLCALRRRSEAWITIASKPIFSTFLFAQPLPLSLSLLSRSFARNDRLNATQPDPQASSNMSINRLVHVHHRARPGKSIGMTDFQDPAYLLWTQIRSLISAGFCLSGFQSIESALTLKPSSRCRGQMRNQCVVISAWSYF